MPAPRIATPTKPTPDLPEHLVETPKVRGFRRLGVGTVPFTAAAVVTLAALSAFVVMSPTASLHDAAKSDRSSGQTADRPTGELASREPRSADSADGGSDDTTTTTATASPSTAPTAETPTTSAKPSSPRTTTPVSDGQLVSLPVSARTTTCSDFTLQPEAQAAFDADASGKAGMDGDGDGIACEQLPGRSVPVPALTARHIPTVQQMMRPSTKLFGVHTPQAPFANSEMESFSSAAGKTPNTVLFFQNYSQDFPSDALDAAWARGQFPMITFEPIVQNSTEGQPTLADISTGEWDDYYTRWATAAKADGRPLAFRFAQEMNGNWYPWSDGRFGNSTGEFVRAWRHIHTLFDDAGADNVIWVWSVNRIDNLPDKTLARVYPGDEWVDWVGASGYLRSVPDGVDPTFDYTFGATLAALHTVAPTKLVMLTEVGAGTTEANRVRWMDTFFQGLLDHPEIIGFNWFNTFKDGGDWRIQYSAGTSSAFAGGVADSRYGEVAPLIE